MSQIGRAWVPTDEQTLEPQRIDLHVTECVIVTRNRQLIRPVRR